MKNAFDLVRDIEPAPLLTPTQEPTFGETFGASLSFKYSPVIDFFRGGSEFGFAPLPEEGYVARQHIPEDLKPYGTSLLRATSQKHMDFLSTSLRNSLKTRETLAESGVLAQFGAEVFDPVNWIALPWSGGKTLAGAAIRGGVSTTAVVAGQEAIRYPLDPLATPEEVGFTLGSSFILGGALNGLATIPARRRIAAQESGAIQTDELIKAIDPTDGAEIDPNIAPSLFTDSWLYTAVTTPMKRVLTDPEIPNSVKLRTLGIANDSGILLAANKKGQKIGNSVFQNAKLHEGEWVGVYDELMEVWGQSTGEGVLSPLDYTYNRAAFEDWITAVDAKAMRKAEPANDFEAQAMERLNTFYANWEVRLRDEGLIGSQSHYEKVIVDRERRIETAQKKLETARNTEYRARLEAQVNRYGDELDEARQTVEDLKDQGPITPPNEEVFRPRYWDRDAISADREGFASILNNWFTANPSTYARNAKSGKYERIDLSTNPEAISKRVDDMIDNLMGESDPLNPDATYYGMGKSKHFKHRVLDIPNELVLDYMVRNPINIMKAYVQRTGSRYEFSRKFSGSSIDDILDDTFVEMMEAGSTPEKAYAAAKDMRHLYDRVAGSVLRSPDSLDQKAGRISRDLAQLNYLGSAGLSTITEPARIIMEHGLGKTFRGLFSILSDNQLKMGGKELRVSGEALEILSGSSHLRLVDDLNNNPLRANFMDKAKDAFYLLNGLAPITRIMKDFDGMMRSHTLIDYSVRLTQGKATKMEQEYLARYNIDASDAQKIANAPWQKSKSGFYMANTDAWTNTIEFPSTTAEVVSGPTESYAAGGRYKPAFYRASENKIFIDEEYIKDVMWHERGWENPRVEGVNPIEKGIINSPDDYVTFIKMHEIMHTNYRPEDLGFVKEQSEKIVVDNSPKGMSRQEIINNIESGSKNPDLAFHVANDAESIIKKGFRGGGTVRGTPVVDAGYGEFVTVFDVRSIVEKLKSNQEFLDAFEITVDQVDDFLENKMYGESLSVEKYGASSKEVTSFKLLEDEKPVAVIHISELPSFSSRRVEGDRMNELGDQQGMYTAETRMVEDYRSGVLNRENVDSYSIPPSYWGGTEDEFFEDLDKIIAEQKKLAEIGENYRPFDEQVFRSSKVVDKANYENAINDLAVAEIKKQVRTDPETVKTFRNALSSGVMNTILMGTPADKPIITDGIVYIPMRVAGQFGMKEDAAYKGYARIENGLLGLPFQFYSYALAAVNKTTAAYGHGQLKSQYVGTAISMGLGYMLLQAKTPDYIDMSFQDQFARSFDYSGVAALYSDMFYTAMSTSLALGGPNITGGGLQPRFPQEPDVVDAATGILGAGPSISTDLARGMYELTTGNVGEGSKEIIRNLPFARLWFLKGKMNEMTRMLETELDEPSGFGRY